MTLEQFFQENPKCALGFSGGVDSAYLLYAGVKAGADIKPYFIKTAFQPAFELADAQKLAEGLGVEVTVLELDALADPRVAANPADRCYYCKQNLFRTLKDRAIADGYPVLLDGTNASDEAGDRPGMRALAELSVRSPLRECGLTKAEIRARSKEAGLFTWDKPAYACLATRVPAGEAITADLLARVEGAEDALFRLGYTDFRVRVFHSAARLQLPRGQMERAVREAEELRQALKPYFTPILLDLEGR
ncbi:ATP-dependent sacrificial sulfur transferase LarE [Flavonifractor sp.]|uniref:ATP-dependent sacrificial sulfur transferase LarE n=1 Tax=Flavonifractor sp. TaxID=2049025 RepID=UPI0025BB3085|nr:ATP-dependent sacrificial sulfur transferase LarE [Flavonifractor sp.]